MKPWERYASLVDDVEAFRKACERQLPTAVRVNPLKATPHMVRKALESEGLDVTERAWNAQTLLLDTEKPGRNWPYQHGWIHGQEEISQLPPVVLDPEPDDVVWDAAAAPGGKATQLAGAVDDGGFVIANDISLGRLSALRSNADRLGVTNMAVTREDARQSSLDGFGIDALDGALVDAPCTGEGTIRKNPDVVDTWSLDQMDSLVSVQTDILKRAIRMTRPGGTVVYSTCTFAPEENEGVLSTVIESEDVTLVPFDVDLVAEPGIESWGDQSFVPSVEHVRRYYPHLNDTGGFVVAKMEVTG